jgi:TIR domain
VADIEPLAFLSYARQDNYSSGGWVDQFRVLLSDGLALQSARAFEVFQDVEDISWGEEWSDRLGQTIERSVFFIPILTPRYFESPPCRSEMRHFRQREQSLCRNDLILPVYLISAAQIDGGHNRYDDLAYLLSTRQMSDWRALRFEEKQSLKLRASVSKMATRILDIYDAISPDAKPGRSLFVSPRDVMIRVLDFRPGRHSRELVRPLWLTANVTLPHATSVTFATGQDERTLGLEVYESIGINAADDPALMNKVCEAPIDEMSKVPAGALVTISVGIDEHGLLYAEVLAAGRTTLINLNIGLSPEEIAEALEE